MRHPTPTQLNEYQEGRLDSRRRWEIGDHLQDCESCRQEAEALLRVQEALDLLDVPANGHPDDEDLVAVASGYADAALRQRVLLHLGECPECATIFGQLPRETQSTPRLLPWLGSVAAAAAVMIVLAIFLHLPQGQRVTDMSAPPSGAVQRSAKGLVPAAPVAPESVPPAAHPPLVTEAAPAAAPPPPAAEAVAAAPPPPAKTVPPAVAETRREPAPAPMMRTAPPARPASHQPAMRPASDRQPGRPAIPPRPSAPTALRSAMMTAESEGLAAPVKRAEPAPGKGVSPGLPLAPAVTKPVTTAPYTRTATGTRATTIPDTKSAGHPKAAPPATSAGAQPGGTAAELATRTAPETTDAPATVPVAPTQPVTDSGQTQAPDDAGDTQPLPDLDLAALRNVKVKPPTP